MKKRKLLLAGILSFVVPGLGQVYAGESFRGGMILAAAIVVGNLNVIILPLIAMANSTIPVSTPDQVTLWSYWIPRLVHDVVSFWSIIFWGWAVLDAMDIVRKKHTLKLEEASETPDI